MKRSLLIAMVVIVTCATVHAQTDSLSIIKGKVKISQTIAIATLFGGDKDQTDYSFTNMEDAAESIDGQATGFGTNLDYSLKIAPVKNPFGLALKLGFIASIDRQSDYFTMDGLLKLGIETGYGHNVGLGIDLLFGGGKSPGYIYDLSATEIEPVPYTDWCRKSGIQLWVRTGLIKSLIPNSQTSIFVRYIYSKEPESQSQLQDLPEMENIYLFWQEESLQVGFLIEFQL